MNKKLKKKHDEFLACCREIYAKSLGWGASGNFSMRVDEETFLITASGSRFDHMAPDTIAQCRIGTLETLSAVTPSVEHKMHRAIFRMRPDVRYIVHVHPLYSVLMISAAKVKIDTHIIPEAGHYLGTVHYVPYCPAGSLALVRAVERKAGDASLIVLKNHGLLALHQSFYAALGALEAFEFIAKLNYHARIAKLVLPAI